MPRTFKTRWFAKKVKKIGISDADLCEAIRQVRIGQAEDLGGGVFKKRLNEGDHRSIVLAKGGQFWIFQFIFPKQNKANLKPDELKDFRELAKGFEALKAGELDELLDDKELVEICHENQDQIQERPV